MFPKSFIALLREHHKYVRRFPMDVPTDGLLAQNYAIPLRATSAKGQFDFHANLSTLCYCPSCLASTCVLLCCEERDQAALIVMLTTSRCRCSCHVFVIPCHAMCSLPMFRSPHAHISIGLAPMSRSPCADVSLGLAPTIRCEYPLALRL